MTFEGKMKRMGLCLNGGVINDSGFIVCPKDAAQAKGGTATEKLGEEPGTHNTLQTAIALLDECNKHLLFCERPDKLNNFSLGFRVATFLDGQRAVV